METRRISLKLDQNQTKNGKMAQEVFGIFCKLCENVPFSSIPHPHTPPLNKIFLFGFSHRLEKMKRWKELVGGEGRGGLASFVADGCYR
jgi:hypothetical protein